MPESHLYKLANAESFIHARMERKKTPSWLGVMFTEEEAASLTPLTQKIVEIYGGDPRKIRGITKNLYSPDATGYIPPEKVGGHYTMETGKTSRHDLVHEVNVWFEDEWNGGDHRGI